MKWLLKKLQDVTGILSDLMYIFRFSPLTIISLAALFFTVWGSDQGQDLMLTINDNFLGPLTLYAVISILAVMNWYFPKFYIRVKWSDKKLKDLFTYPFDFRPSMSRYFPNQVTIPRLLGVLTFLIPAFGMLKVLSIFELLKPSIGILPIAALAITTLFFEWCFRKNYFKFYATWPKVFSIVCILLLLSPLILWPFNHNRPIDIRLLFWGLLCYAFLFALVTSNREDLMVKIKLLNSKYITPVIWVITIFPTALFVYYFACNIFYCPGFRVPYMTFAIVMSGIITYYAVFTVINIIGKKNNINLSLLLIIALALAAANLPNKYHFVDVQAKNNTKPALTLREYAKKWLEDRYKPADSSKPYQVYIVNTYGGGIRAASWTCLAMSKLDSLQYRKNHTLFQDHVLAYSGASGGTIGASILCANGFAKHARVRSGRYNRFFKKDLLTPVLTGLIGNDIWYACLDISCGKDRSKVQEHLWEYYCSQVFHSDKYSKNIDELWDGSNTTVPLLFSNTTDLKQGCKGIMAPVILDTNDFPGCTFVRDLYNDKSTLRLSTAAFLSARFPYLSPAGGFDENHHFLDGGMVENSGAETAMQLYRVLKQIIDSNENYKKYFRVNIISLNSAYHGDTVVLNKKKNLSQIFAPITGIINVGLTGNTTRSDNGNRNYFKPDTLNPAIGNYYKVQPIVERIQFEQTSVLGKDTFVAKVALPLGWSISDIALMRIRASLDALCDPDKTNARYNNTSVPRDKIGLLYDIVNKP